MWNLAKVVEAQRRGWLHFGRSTTYVYCCTLLGRGGPWSLGLPLSCKLLLCLAFSSSIWPNWHCPAAFRRTFIISNRKTRRTFRWWITIYGIRQSCAATKTWSIRELSSGTDLIKVYNDNHNPNKKCPVLWFSSWKCDWKSSEIVINTARC